MMIGIRRLIKWEWRILCRKWNRKSVGETFRNPVAVWAVETGSMAMKIVVDFACIRFGYMQIGRPVDGRLVNGGSFNSVQP